jgi:signal peptidase II
MQGEGRRGSPPGRGALLFLILGVVVATIGCDRVTKSLAESRLSGLPPQTFLTGAVRLEYAENTGAFLSLGAELPAWARTALFGVGSALSLALLPLLAARHRCGSAALVGLGLVWAGGASNLIDRVTRGSVVDFLNVGVGPVRTGIFNVADVAITAGALLVVYGWGRTRRSGGFAP